MQIYTRFYYTGIVLLLLILFKSLYLLCEVLNSVNAVWTALACAQGNCSLIIIQFNPIVVVVVWVLLHCSATSHHAQQKQLKFHFRFERENTHARISRKLLLLYLKYIIDIARSTHLYGGNCNITWSLLSCYVALKCSHICNVVLLLRTSTIESVFTYPKKMM